MKRKKKMNPPKKFRTWAGLVTCIVLVFASAACSQSPEERRKKFIAAGDRLVQKKDWARAILEFKNAAQAMPAHPEAYYRLALAHLAEGDVRMGIIYLQKTLQLDPKHVDAQLKLAELMIVSEDQTILQDAQNRLRSLLAATPDSAEAVTALALAEWKLAQPALAEKHLMEVLQRMPRNLQAAVSLARIKVAQKKFAEAEAQLQSIARQSPPMAAAYVALGEFYLSQNRTQDAARSFEQALATEPSSPQALMGLASTHLIAGDWREAEKIYRRISNLPDEKARNVHALFLLQSKRYGEAAREFAEVLKKFPNDRDARTGLISAYVFVKNYHDAEIVLNAALKKNGNDVPALLQRAALMMLRNNWDSAEADVRGALRADPDSAEAHYLMSKVHGSRQTVELQRAELHDALRLDPTLLAARLELARLYTRTNDPKAALEILNNAPRHQREITALVAEQNWAKLALGQRTEAELNLKDAVARKTYPDLSLQDGILKMDRHDYQGARKSAQDVLAANAEDLRGLQLLLQSYVGEKRVSEGVAEIQRYAMSHQASAVVQQFAGTVLLAHGDKENARNAFERARAADPYMVAPDLSLARMALQDGRVDESQAALEKLTRRLAKDETAHLWLGHIALMKNEYQKAIQEYQNVLSINPKNVNALNNLAYILSEHANQPERALAYAQQARELAPNSAAVANTLGKLYYRKGLYSLAVPLLKEAVDREKTESRVFDLGLAYIKDGDIINGREALTAGLKMGSHTPQAAEAREILASLKSAPNNTRH
jgi:putative PEP-CTERM system TPR-repeat lipoprotein